MIKSQLPIEDVLFDVKLHSLFVNQVPDDAQRGFMVDDWGDDDYELRRVPGFKAVMAEDDGHIFSVVAPNYRLVTNREALDLGILCFSRVFKVLRPEEMVVFNIIMPKTRSYCHIDIYHPEKSFDLFARDRWFPYLRITNSYNRMFALGFSLAFFRVVCSNGLIFWRNFIEFKFYHSKAADDPKVEFTLKADELATMKTQFIESLKKLKRFHMPQEVMWPLACKIFNIKLPENPNDRQSIFFEEKRFAIRSLSERYFKELGENGYAAMNVLTDFASRPIGMISPEGRIDGLQRITGAWVADFVDSIEATDFNFEDYLGEYAELIG